MYLFWWSRLFGKEKSKGLTNYCNHGYCNGSVNNWSEMKTVRFYNRKQELDILASLRQQTLYAEPMTVLTGRRRIGKTRLALEFTKNHKCLYFLLPKNQRTTALPGFS